MDSADVTIDDLFTSGLKVIQPRHGYRIGIDTFLLAGFACLPENARVADLGSGTGGVSLLLAARHGNVQITGLEIQPDLNALAQQSARLNGLSARIAFCEGDIRKPPPVLKSNYFDVVVSNPPYLRQNQGRLNRRPGEAIAKHEIACSLDDVLRTAKRILRQGGRFFLINRADRLAEALCLLQKHRLEPKRLCLVHPTPGREANLFLAEAGKGGGQGMTVLPPLFIYNEHGNYTRAVLNLYMGHLPGEIPGKETADADSGR